MPNHVRDRAPVGVVTVMTVVLVSATIASATATTRVYRCTESGAVLYTDAPCRDASIVDLPADRAAPDAVERLRRDQQMLDASAAERRLRIAREQAERDAQRAQASVDRDAIARNDAGTIDGGYGGYGGYGYGTYGGPYVDPRVVRPRRAARPTDVRARMRPAQVISVPLPVHRPPDR